MYSLRIEIQKLRRTGVLETLFFAGIAGAVYVALNWYIRKDYLLTIDIDPMNSLLTQLYGVLSLLNMLAVIVSTSNIYSIEYQYNALKKMQTLPFKIGTMFIRKLQILLFMLLGTYVIQFVALATLGKLYLPSGTFNMSVLVQFAFYVFLLIVPCLVFMLIVSILSQNMWITVGIGIVGFFSGMSMVSMANWGSYLNPFVFLLKPAMSLSTDIDQRMVVIALVEILIFVAMGMWIANRKKGE
ncbi:lantibiotic ABC transporter permease [Bacillaceae bacterium SAS-127]|nr:lantibiotic ABC transporter permease [Bacillaceae bacterium SAS-127]